MATSGARADEHRESQVGSENGRAGDAPGEAGNTESGSENTEFSVDAHSTPASESSASVSGGLRITIVGAGIGGLSAALALRQVPNGSHKITLLEQTAYSSEAGAAIHMAPNANGLLKRLGVRAEDAGANELLKVRNPDDFHMPVYRLAQVCN